MNRLRWEFMNRVRGIGLPGWVALGLALLCAGAWWGAVLPRADDARRLDERAAALSRRLKDPAATDTAKVLSASQQLAAFEQRFSGEKSLSSSLARLHATAKRQGVQLAQGEFKLTSEAREPLARYAIVLPVKADYRALRRFIREALREQPGLAMEELNLRRGDARSTVLDAQLRFVLFVTKAD